MKFLITLLAILFFGSIALAQQPALNTFQGGTGTSSPSGILYGDGTIRLKTVNIGSNLTFTGGTLSATGGGSKWATSTVDSTAIQPAGALKVGIGTSTPSQTLSLQGSALFSGDLKLASLIATGTLTVAESADPSNPPADNLHIYVSDKNGVTILNSLDSSGFMTRLARDNLIIGRNTTLSTLNKGEAVYITGSTGNVPNFGRAQANDTATLPAVGLAAESITVNGFGRVLIYGLLTNFDTSNFAEGDIVYVSTSTAGGITNIQPIFPLFAQRVGVVTNSGAGNGAIEANARDVGNILTTANNNAGLGTSTPARFFSVHGSALFSGNLSLASLTATGTITFSGLSNGAVSVSSGVLQSGTLAVGNGGTGVTSLSDILGTSNQVTVSGGTARVIGGNVTLSAPQNLHTGADFQVGTLKVATSSSSFALALQGNALFSGDISAANITATGTIIGVTRGVFASSSAAQAIFNNDALTAGGGISSWDGAVRTRLFSASPSGYVGTAGSHAFRIRTSDTDRIVIGASGVSTTSIPEGIVNAFSIGTTTESGTQPGVFVIDTSGQSGRVEIGTPFNLTSVAKGKLTIRGAGVTTGASLSILANDLSRRLTLQDNNHVNFSGVLPTASECGGGAINFQTGSNDVIGKVTIGTGTVTYCQINFAATWSRAPTCFAINEDAVPSNVTSSSTTVIFGIGSTANIAGNVIAYMCVSRI